MKKRIIDQQNKAKFQMDDKYVEEYADVCTWKATLVYVCLCRRADKDQRSFPSIANMAKQHGVSRDTIIDGIKSLEAWNLIHVERKKGTNSVWKNNRYTLLDKSVWKAKPVADNTGYLSRPQQLNPVANTDSKDTHMKGNTYKDSAEASSAEWLLTDFIKELEDSEDRKLNIIALYFQIKQLKLTNQLQADGEVKRSLRAAKQLEPYEDQRLGDTMKWLEKRGKFKWTLESVVKYINEDLTKLGE